MDGEKTEDGESVGDTDQDQENVAKLVKEKLDLSPYDCYNKTLVNHVHPLDYVDPEPQSIYNLVVIGAGAGGRVLNDRVCL